MRVNLFFKMMNATSCTPKAAALTENAVRKVCPVLLLALLAVTDIVAPQGL